MNLSFDKRVIAGIATILMGLLLLASDLVMTEISYSVINAGTIITIASYALSKSKDKTPHDERTRAIGAKAASYSWMLTLALIAILVWVVKLQWLSLSTEEVLGIILAEMTTTMLVYRWWFNKKLEI